MNRIYKCFPGGKFKVLTLSYDDGKIQDRRLVDIFNKNGIRATFNVNSQLTDMDIRLDSDEWSSLYKNHEIALHTCTHPTMNRCGSYEITREILEDKTAIEKIIKRPVRGMALPNGAGNKLITSIAADLGIKYIRPAADQYAVVKSAIEYADCCEGPILLGDENGFSMPSDYMNWVPTCHHNHNLVEFGKRFMALTKKQYLYMMYVWGHSYEFTNQNNWELMEDFCKLVGKRDDIWYATNIEIVDYLDAAKRLQYTADCSHVYNPSAASVWICVNDTNFIELKGGTMTELPIGEWAK